MKFKKAFTMAEAILVMTILGIIATIMITTLKPAEYKNQGLAILAKKVLSEIDTATTQILINNSEAGTMSTLYQPGTSTIINAATANAVNSGHVGTLYKRYLTATRKACNNANCPCNGYANRFYLKDGACMGITVGTPTANQMTRFPGELEDTEMAPANISHGVIFFDINGEAEPNVAGSDRFLLPLDDSGIKYAE